jgi:segregation and condensation protein B
MNDFGSTLDPTLSPGSAHPSTTSPSAGPAPATGAPGSSASASDATEPSHTAESDRLSRSDPASGADPASDAMPAVEARSDDEESRAEDGGGVVAGTMVPIDDAGEIPGVPEAHAGAPAAERSDQGTVDEQLSALADAPLDQQTGMSTDLLKVTATDVVGGHAGVEDSPGPDEDAPGLETSGTAAAPGVPAGTGEPTDDLADPDRLRAALEAVLLVVDVPTSSIQLAQVLQRPVADIDAALRSLRQEYDNSGRGLDLREVADGWRLFSRDEFAGYVERFVLDGQQARLTQAALETLAVIAYRQPVTRSRISAIRGVSVDAVMRTLLTRGLVEECGADPDTGGGLFRTTRLFLEKLGLRSLDELPSLAPLLPDTSQLDDVAVST